MSLNSRLQYRLSPGGQYRTAMRIQHLSPDAYSPHRRRWVMKCSKRMNKKVYRCSNLGQKWAMKRTSSPCPSGEWDHCLRGPRRLAQAANVHFNKSITLKVKLVGKSSRYFASKNIKHNDRELSPKKLPLLAEKEPKFIRLKTRGCSVGELRLVGICG